MLIFFSNVPKLAVSDFLGHGRKTHHLRCDINHCRDGVGEYKYSLSPTFIMALSSSRDSRRSQSHRNGSMLFTCGQRLRTYRGTIRDLGLSIQPINLAL